MRSIRTFFASNKNRQHIVGYLYIPMILLPLPLTIAITPQIPRTHETNYQNE